MRYYQPRPTNHAHQILPLLLLVISAVSLGGAPVAFLPWMLRFVGIATLAVALWLVARYSLSPRRYTLTDATPASPYGTFAMEVVGGAFPRVLCAVSLADATALVPYVSRRALRRTYPGPLRIVDGRSYLLSRNVLVLVVRDDTRTIVMLLEADAHFAAVLAAQLPPKSENTADAEK